MRTPRGLSRSSVLRHTAANSAPPQPLRCFAPPPLSGGGYSADRKHSAESPRNPLSVDRKRRALIEARPVFRRIINDRYPPRSAKHAVPRASTENTCLNQCKCLASELASQGEVSRRDGGVFFFPSFFSDNN